MMSKSRPALSPEFISRTLGSQKVFRLALAALSRPASPLAADFAGLFAESPPLPAVLAALALTLTDAAVSVWLSESLQEAAGWLVFHRAPVLAADPGRASFVIAACPGELPPLHTLNPGLARFPDRSATVFLGGVLDAAGRPAKSRPAESRPLTASGPGLKEPAVFSGHGLSSEFIAGWAENRALYPLGVDVFLAGEKLLAGLPRSVSLAAGF
jgi:alpha-D-ribose 1-methylphosphonate 5-triphosphate synthase subunit PhnH